VVGTDRVPVRARVRDPAGWSASRPCFAQPVAVEPLDRTGIAGLAGTRADLPRPFTPESLGLPRSGTIERSRGCRRPDIDGGRVTLQWKRSTEVSRHEPL
jgi:hypothetical protein